MKGVSKPKTRANFKLAVRGGLASAAHIPTHPIPSQLNAMTATSPSNTYMIASKGMVFYRMMMMMMGILSILEPSYNKRIVYAFAYILCYTRGDDDGL